jgi:hypothetical protein
MGRRERGQSQFFYAFDLDKAVPADHLVRQIDGVLDLDWVQKELAAYYSHTGRPSIDPVLMIRMLIVGYVFAIRHIGRFASSASRMGYPTIRCSAVPGMSAFAKATRYAGYLRASWQSALRPAWSAARAFRSMRA